MGSSLVMTKSKIGLVSGMAIVSLAASLAIRHRSDLDLRERDGIARQQETQLAELAAENQRLSNLLAQVNNAPINDPTGELRTLRSQAEALRKQTHELGKQLAENRRSRPSQTPSKPAPRPPEYYQQVFQMAAVKPAEARNLATAFLEYADDHQNQVPSKLDQVAPYLRESRSLTRANEFDIVYQGSLDDLKKVPSSSVALVRSGQTWLGPSGKRTRVYGLADGSGQIVESDDNFQSWEAEHIIPPPAPSPSPSRGFP